MIVGKKFRNCQLKFFKAYERRTSNFFNEQLFLLKCITLRLHQDICHVYDILRDIELL